MFFTKKNRKSLILHTIVLIFGMFLIFSSKSVYSESMVSDATVEVVREDPSTNKKISATQSTLPKTNEQINFVIIAIGVLIILYSAKLICYEYGSIAKL
ncbi:hypothetical protein A5819_003571 [Enterococcus sp. 7E2_DIV0204]|uniref:hypothetical protein n=1 Tax=unclassified Enterococcus TaxID=2608891 RepID=UPI000A3492E8|nr:MULTISPECIES: hypothetical protein [unclassified Enterococcus]OTN84021.1 hypothetical protein A5819_003571 [Enterococcus sp. 7E2_DIV0204]OTP47196.1 hypothetical protein A5884_003571 [Enterococcus sp. 7D2_DIV0200]